MGQPFGNESFPLRAYAVLSPVSRSYPPPKDMFPYITHPCATDVLLHPFNLHVLGLPPAFVLSQDQTLIFIPRAVLCISITFFKKLINRNPTKLTIYSIAFTISLHFRLIVPYALSAPSFLQKQQLPVHPFPILSYSLSSFNNPSPSEREKQYTLFLPSCQYLFYLFFAPLPSFLHPPVFITPFLEEFR